MAAITNSQTQDQWLCCYLYFFTGGNAPLQHDDQNRSLDHSAGEIDPPLNYSGSKVDHPINCSADKVDPSLNQSVDSLLDHPADDALLLDHPADDAPLLDHPADDAPLLNHPADDAPLLNHPADDVLLLDHPADDAPLLNHPADDAPLLDHPADDALLLDHPADDIAPLLKKRNEAARKLHASIRTKAHNRKKKAEKKVIDVETYEANTTQMQPDCWIEALNLLVSEKQILESEEWLSAPIINASQFVLAKQFERKLHGAGFQDVSGSLTMNFLIERDIFIQILHEPRGHWLTISNIGAKNSEIFVYDSLYSSCSSNVQQQIACLLKAERPNIELHFVDVHMQSGGSDCGAFAIAYATALCLGKLPGKFVFDQTVMRQHLLKCLEMQCFTMFPVHSERRQGGRIRSKQTVKLYCQCRMPDIVGEPMIRCNKCKEWFHGKICVAVPQKAWKTNAPWFCPSCI